MRVSRAEADLADAGKMVHERNANVAQMVRRPNTGKHEQVRRGDRPGAQHDLLPMDDELFAAAFDDHADGVLALEQEMGDVDIRSDGQVEPMASQVQISQRRADTDAIAVVHREWPHAGGLWAIHVPVLGEARIDTSLIKPLRQAQPRLALVSTDRKRA